MGGSPLSHILGSLDQVHGPTCIMKDMIYNLSVRLLMGLWFATIIFITLPLTKWLSIMVLSLMSLFMVTTRISSIAPFWWWLSACIHGTYLFFSCWVACWWLAAGCSEPFHISILCWSTFTNSSEFIICSYWIVYGDSGLKGLLHHLVHPILWMFLPSSPSRWGHHCWYFILRCTT